MNGDPTHTLRSAATFTWWLTSMANAGMASNGLAIASGLIAISDDTDLTDDRVAEYLQTLAFAVDGAHDVVETIGRTSPILSDLTPAIATVIRRRTCLGDVIDAITDEPDPRHDATMVLLDCIAAHAIAAIATSTLLSHLMLVGWPATPPDPRSVDILDQVLPDDWQAKSRHTFIRHGATVADEILSFLEVAIDALPRPAT